MQKWLDIPLRPFVKLTKRNRTELFRIFFPIYSLLLLFWAASYGDSRRKAEGIHCVCVCVHAAAAAATANHTLKLPLVPHRALCI
jgi:hypothetical protein